MCLLSVKNLRDGYKDNIVLKNVSLDIEEGKIYSILGPNGCGKTTLMRVMGRNKKPMAGIILLEGEELFQLPGKKVARKIGLMAQLNRSVDLRVSTLVGYGRYAHKKWWEGNKAEDAQVIQWALARTGMKELADRRISTLSGGERQRAWLAMSIAQKPTLLLLDEPTTYLDIAHQLEIMELVKKLNQEEGITIVMVLHDINHALRYSDELLLLKDGSIYAQKDPWSLAKDGVLSDVFRVEAELLGGEEKPVFYAKKVRK